MNEDTNGKVVKDGTPLPLLGRGPGGGGGCRKLSPDEFLQRCNDGILLDVRTQAEFDEGHIGGAINFPLFTNEERVVVGTLYKQAGKENAIVKGLEFVGPRMARMVKQARKLSQGKPLYVHCWRGGMRSGSVAWLLSMAGMEVYLLEGGYKAYRQRFRELLAEKRWKFIVLGGPTGCGKTEILLEMARQGAQVLDLEGLACHRGSAFGGLGLPAQPNNEQMTNRVFDTLRSFDPSLPVWTEGESYSIGKVSLLRDLYDVLVQSPFIYFDRSVDERIERILDEYGTFGKEGLIESFRKIEKRMGNDRTRQAIEAVEQDDLRTAVLLALEYYDKGYEQAISAKRQIVSRYRSTGEPVEESARRLITEGGRF